MSMFLRRCSLVALAPAALLASCSPLEPPPGDYPAVSHDAGDAGLDAPQETSGGSGTITPDGTWLFWYETATCVNVMGVAIESLTWGATVLWMEPQADSGTNGTNGSIVKQRIRTCYYEQTPIVGVATSIPRQLIDRIPEVEFLAILDDTSAGSGYETQVKVELWGTKLTDPRNEDLPTSKDDPRVYDMDEDGQPGVTLDLGDGECKMSVVERTISQWKGVVESDTRIGGGGYNHVAQNVLEATGGFCSSQFETWHMPNRSRFVIMRADGQHGAENLDTNQDGQIDCDEVRAYGTAPFGPRSVNNAYCSDGG